MSSVPFVRKAPVVDEASVTRVVSAYSLSLPCAAARGKSGIVRSVSAGASLELFDFRAYYPGDDPRQIDWNAFGRTDELIVRVREDEVSPRVQLVIDGSRSIAISEAKAARVAEIGLALATMALAARLELRLVVTSETARAAHGQEALAALRELRFDARDDLVTGLDRSPPFLRAGLRLVVSDFLCPLSPLRVVRRLHHGADLLRMVQVLDPADTEPPPLEAARLVDCESEEASDRVLTPAAVAAFVARLGQHQRELAAVAAKLGALLAVTSAASSLDQLARGALAPILVPRRA